MWFPCDEIKELNLDLPKELGIKINYLKIRKTEFGEEIKDISNLDFIDLEEIRNFKTAKRSEEHATGRYLLFQMFRKNFPSIDPKLIRVSRDENRAPYFEWKDNTNETELLPNFSISTTRGMAIVAISNANLRIGIDVEISNQNRSKNLLEFLSNGLELEQIKLLYESDGNNTLNKIWTIKESILKALRVGMSISPTQIKIMNKNNKFEQNINYDGSLINFKNYLIKFKEEYFLSIAYGKLKSAGPGNRTRTAGLEGQNHTARPVLQ